jgi:acyl carrier protein
MTPNEARALIVDALGAVAPEIDASTIDPHEDLSVEADLDSIDFLAVVTRVSEAIGRDIPERDYPQLASLDGFAEYISVQAAGAA